MSNSQYAIQMMLAKQQNGKIVPIASSGIQVDIDLSDALLNILKALQPSLESLTVQLLTEVRSIRDASVQSIDRDTSLKAINQLYLDLLNGSKEFVSVSSSQRTDDTKSITITFKEPAK